MFPDSRCNVACFDLMNEVEKARVKHKEASPFIILHFFRTRREMSFSGREQLVPCLLDFRFQAFIKCRPGVFSQKIRSLTHRQQRLMFLSLDGMFCECGVDTPCETDTTS